MNDLEQLNDLIAALNGAKKPDWLLLEAMADLGETTGQSWPTALRWLVRGKRHPQKTMGRILPQRCPWFDGKAWIWVWATHAQAFSVRLDSGLPFDVYDPPFGHNANEWEVRQGAKQQAGRTKWRAYLLACEKAYEWLQTRRAT